MAEVKTRSYELILEQIRETIVHGELKVGDRFPAERELAERFSVSRVPVREAIKILEYIGVLEVTSNGTYLKNVEPGDIISKINFGFAATNQAINELMEVRCELECIAASLAAQRRTSEDIDAMEQTLKQFYAVRCGGDPLSEEASEKLHAASCHFHELIVRATKNNVLIQTYSGLFELLEISMQYTGVSFNSVKAYETILLHIINHDSEGAKSCMCKHMIAAKEKLSKAMLDAALTQGTKEEN